MRERLRLLARVCRRVEDELYRSNKKITIDLHLKEEGINAIFTTIYKGQQLEYRYLFDWTMLSRLREEGIYLVTKNGVCKLDAAQKEPG